MKAYQIRSYDAAPKLVKIDRPEPGPGEVLVKVAACGLNFADLLMAKGTYQVKPALPFTLGMEIAGTVEALGPDIPGPAPGTRVAAMVGHGGLADYATVAAEACVAIPDTMPFDHAAGFQVTYGTSQVGLAHRARLRPGETLLVLGAAGGVGLTAVEIGKLMGARVIAAARGRAKLEVCRAAGADHLIDTEADDIREAVRALGGADVVCDPVGGAQFAAALRAMNPEGRLLVVGFASGDVPQIPANHLLVKNIDVLGYWWGGYARFRPQVLSESMAALIGWYEAGRLNPHVGASLPLDQADAAYELLRSRASTGKVVVTMGSRSGYSE